MDQEHVETVVIGAGQAGLATAYHLTRRGRPCVVLEASARVGEVWRRRYDSLRLFTPARYDSLPGLAMPLPGWEFPTGRDMGDYLEAYAATLELPIRTGVEVERVSRLAEGYLLTTSSGAVVRADNVVVATGTWRRPRVPDFAGRLDPAIRQLHSADYRNPSQLQPGPVLLVGASHTGADLALELSGRHETRLAGRIHGELPFRIDSRTAHLVTPVMWFAWNHVLTEATPIGRKMRDHVRRGGAPLIRVKRRDLRSAGVQHTEQRVVDVIEGRPALADGTVLDVANVIWCTGYSNDFSWIDAPLGEGTWPEQIRGVVSASPGLYFVGLPFLRGFYSMLTGGVARDAGYVARHITRRMPQPNPAPLRTDPAAAA